MPKTKYSYEQVKLEFASRGYQLLDTEYRGANYKLKYFCLKHREKGVLEIDFRHFHDRKQGCPYCYQENRGYAHTSEAEIIQLCDKNNYIYVSSNYNGEQIIVFFVCRNHISKGIQRTSLCNLKKKIKIGCKYCWGMGKKNHEDFIEEVAMINKNIKVLGRYVNAKTDILCECIICHHQWLAKPNNLLSSKTGCPVCGHKKSNQQKTKSTESFMQELNNKKINAIPLEKYRGATVNINFKCLKCNTIYQTTPDSVLHSKWGSCPVCSYKMGAKAQTKTHEQFLLELKNINPHLIPLEKYKTDHEKILMYCTIHDYTWKTTPNKILRRQTGCPKCNIYTNELQIAQILDRWGFRYELQKIFKGCRDINVLPFDFYLPDANILIEYDGEGHYIPIPRNSDQTIAEAEENLFITQKHDIIKDSFCKNQGIPLIRIPYWENDELEMFLFEKFVENQIIEEIS